MMQIQKTAKNRVPGLSVYHNGCFAMGTRLNVVVADTIDSGDALFDEIVRKVRQIEAKISRFDERSALYHINRYVGSGSIEIDSEMSRILSLCIDYYQRTDGTFDVTLPSKAGINHRFGKIVPRGFSLSNLIELDSQERTVVFRDSRIQIDLGGFGKGYALQEVASLLYNRGVRNAIVSFGESSILTMGRHPYGDCWKIGIEDMSRPGTSAHVFELRNQSLSVSGFQQSITGTSGFHIISPDTLRPLERTSTVAVQSSDPLEAEVLSTAVYAALESEAAFLGKFPDCTVIRVDYMNDQLREIFFYG